MSSRVSTRHRLVLTSIVIAAFLGSYALAHRRSSHDGPPPLTRSQPEPRSSAYTSREAPLPRKQAAIDVADQDFRITVLDTQGGGIPGATAFDAAHSTELLRSEHRLAVADDHGVVTILSPQLPHGGFVAIGAPNYISASLQLSTPGSYNVTLTPAISQDVSVVDLTGNPIPGALIVASVAQPNSELINELALAEQAPETIAGVDARLGVHVGTTDRNGRAHLTGLQAGAYHVMVVDKFRINTSALLMPGGTQRETYQVPAATLTLTCVDIYGYFASPSSTQTLVASSQRLTARAYQDSATFLYLEGAVRPHLPPELRNARIQTLAIPLSPNDVPDVDIVAYIAGEDAVCRRGRLRPLGDWQRPDPLLDEAASVTATAWGNVRLVLRDSSRNSVNGVPFKLIPKQRGIPITARTGDVCPVPCGEYTLTEGSSSLSGIMDVSSPLKNFDSDQPPAALVRREGAWQSVDVESTSSRT